MTFRSIALVGLCIWWPTMAIITHLPGESLPATPAGGDKIEHVIGYGILSALLTLATRWPWWLIAIIALAYGAADELTQPWFDRTCALDDYIANIVGVTIGLSIALLARTTFAKRIAPKPMA